MIEVWVFIAAFLTGVLRSTVRSLTTRKSTIHKISAYIFGILYGCLFGLLIHFSTNTYMTALWFGLLIALIISNRMRGFAHLLGIAVVIIFVGFGGLEQLNWVFFVIFALVAIVDEILGSKIRKPRDFPHLLIQFVGLEIISILISFFTGIWSLFVVVFLYDVGFLLVDTLLAGKIRPGDHHKDKKRRRAKKIIEGKVTHHEL